MHCAKGTSLTPREQNVTWRIDSKLTSGIVVTEVSTDRLSRRKS